METTFALHGGYPAKDTSSRIYEELDFERAVQIYIWATPAVEMEVIQEGLERDLGLTSLATIGVFENFLDAKTVVATGNGQSIYAFGNIDLSRTGPVVIEAPPGVLGFLMTLWQQPLSDIGRLGPDAGKGGRYLVLPPGRDLQTPPPDHFVVHSDTMLINWLVRGFIENGEPDSAVRSIKSMRIYRLAENDAPPTMKFINVSGKKATLVPLGDSLNGLGFFERVARFVDREPVREQDKQFLGMLATLGIEKGRPFVPDGRVREILTRAARTGAAMVATLAYDSRSPTKLRWPETSRWEELFGSEYTDFTNPNYVELDSRAALYYQAAGASTNALLDIVGAGSKYAATFKDREGQWLDGSDTYRLRVPANPPVKDFWSVTVYDAVTRSMIDTDQGISGLDSYHRLTPNDDGSIDLYFGPSAPAARGGNWVKTNLEIGFFLYFRWYGPLEPYFDKSWKLPDVERLR